MATRKLPEAPAPSPTATGASTRCASKAAAQQPTIPMTIASYSDFTAAPGRILADAAQAADARPDDCGVELFFRFRAYLIGLLSYRAVSHSSNRASRVWPKESRIYQACLPLAAGSNNCRFGYAGNIRIFAKPPRGARHHCGQTGQIDALLGTVISPILKSFYKSITRQVAA